MTTRYEQIAADLRRRLAATEWAVGDQLPGIAALMEQYGASINTIRAAQSQLAREGMIRIEQGVRPQVLSTRSLREVDVASELDVASTAIDKVRAALAARQRGEVTITLDDDNYYVLTEALNNFAATERSRLEDDGGRRHHLECAAHLLDLIEEHA